MGCAFAKAVHDEPADADGMLRVSPLTGEDA